MREECVTLGLSHFHSGDFVSHTRIGVQKEGTRPGLEPGYFRRRGMFALRVECSMLV